MKIGVVVASEKALPTAFAVFRGFQAGIEQAARLGYDGVELAVRDGGDFHPAQMQKLLDTHHLEVSAISTGQLFADKKLWLSARDETVRKAAIHEFYAIIDMAAALGCLVNMGRSRGFVEDGDMVGQTTARFVESMQKVAPYAQKNGVKLVIEPVNRYETNYIGSVEEGAALLDVLRSQGIDGLGLMPDFFHMNIEDASMEAGLRKYAAFIDYIHIADSNRLAPGWGHTDIPGLLNVLRETGYDGWVTMEVLPQPTPMDAAKQAIAFTRPLLGGVQP